MFAGCPIHWLSRLQTEIELSTTEAEYIALSTAAREVFPLQDILNDIRRHFKLDQIKSTIKSRIFEDNMGAQQIATSPKMTPRTKHIAIKYHHFRSFVQNGTVTIHSIDTKEQLADILTKPLVESSFCYLRRNLMGW